MTDIILSKKDLNIRLYNIIKEGGDLLKKLNENSLYFINDKYEIKENNYIIFEDKNIYNTFINNNNYIKLELKNNEYIIVKLDNFINVTNLPLEKFNYSLMETSGTRNIQNYNISNNDNFIIYKSGNLYKIIKKETARGYKIPKKVIIYKIN